jgi:hypothetical protein
VPLHILSRHFRLSQVRLLHAIGPAELLQPEDRHDDVDLAGEGFTLERRLLDVQRFIKSRNPGHPLISCFDRPFLAANSATMGTFRPVARALAFPPEGVSRGGAGRPPAGFVWTIQ